MFVFTLLIASAFGILAAAVQLAIQKGIRGGLASGSGLRFLTGTLFPVSSLPAPRASTVPIIPITYLLDGMRLAPIEGAPTVTFASRHPGVPGVDSPARILLPLGGGRFSWTLPPGPHTRRRRSSLLTWGPADAPRCGTFSEAT